MGVEATRESRRRVADMLEKLADGGAVQLGQFGDNGTDTDQAGEDAALLRDLADAERKTAAG